MGKPLLAMPRLDDEPCVLSGAAQGQLATRSDFSNVLLDQAPGGFDGVEVMRVGREITEPRSARDDRRFHSGIFVRTQVVEYDDVAAAQAGGEPLSDPRDEAFGVHRLPGRAQGQPAVLP